MSSGCGAQDSSYDYSYNYRDVEDIADERMKDDDGAVQAAAFAVLGVAVLLW